MRMDALKKLRTMLKKKNIFIFAKCFVQHYVRAGHTHGYALCAIVQRLVFVCVAVIFLQCWINRIVNYCASV